MSESTPPPAVFDDESYDAEQLVLSDLINRVLDKGVVISSNITISIADVDLIQIDLRVLISSIETMAKRTRSGGDAAHGDLPVRPRSDA